MAKVKISDELYEKIEKLAEIAGYSSPDEFAQHALEKEIGGMDDSGDEEAVRKKLQGLGYI